METLPIPLASKTLKNVDEIGLTDQSAEIINFYIDSAGGLSKIPGLVEQLVLPVGPMVMGLHWWNQAQIVIGFTDSKIYKIGFNGVFSYSDLSPPAMDLVPAGRPTFATARVSGGTSTYLFIANGAKIVYSDGVAAFQAIADADCPTKVTHVVHMDGYLLCNDLDNPTRIFFSDFNDPTAWSNNFISAEADPDNVLALHSWNGEIYAFGTKTIEIIETDATGVATFKRIPGGVIRSGLSATYSVVVTDNEIFWLDNKRRFVKYSGNGVQSISSPYDKEIQKLNSVSDCYGYQIEFEGNSFIIFHFTSADRSYAYNVQNDSWSRWGYWESEMGGYSIWKGNSYCFAGLWGLHLVGATDSGAINTLSSENYLAGSDVIRTLVRTGLIDHKTSKLKQSHKIRFRAKSGVGLSDRTPQLMVRWNDDNKGWVNWKTVSLGDIGNRKPIKELSTKGHYHTRQWEFACSDDVPLSLYSLEEDVTLLR